MAYDTDWEELTVVYTGGGEYCYMDVPFNVAIAASEADSVGQYVNQNIKGVYESFDPSKRLSDEVILTIASEAVKLSALIDEIAGDRVYLDAAAEPVNRLQTSLDDSANRLESLVKNRQ